MVQTDYQVEAVARIPVKLDRVRLLRCRTISLRWAHLEPDVLIDEASAELESAVARRAGLYLRRTAGKETQLQKYTLDSSCLGKHLSLDDARRRHRRASTRIRGETSLEEQAACGEKNSETYASAQHCGHTAQERKRQHY
jgi:hypothetical protein